VGALAVTRRHLARWGELYAVPVFYALVVAWVYRDLWHQRGIATGLGWDTIDTHGPDLDFFARELREGRFSLWNPYDKGGYPVFCDPVFDRYYPLNWPFAAWGALFGTGWWLVQVKVMAHHLIAGAMMHLFLRSRGLSPRAALTGGTALVACAPLLVHKASNILWPLVWVPLVWSAIDFVLARPSWRRGAALGGALLLAMTAGSPPGLFYAGLLIAPYALVRLVETLARPDRRSPRALGQLVIAGGVALGIAALVACVTVIPTGMLVELGSRDRFARPGRDFALALSLDIWPATRGVFVRGAGLFEMYMGAATCVLAMCAFVLPRRGDRGAVFSLVLTAIAGVLLAAGATYKLLPWLVDHVSLFGMLRVPGRYKLLTAWSLAALAGFGAGELERVDGRWRWVVVAIGVLAMSLAVGWYVTHPLAASARDRPAWWSLAATALPVALVIAAAWSPHRIAGHVLGALAICVLVDAPLFTHVPPGALPAAESRRRHEQDAAFIPKLEGARDRWRIYDEFVLGERAGARLRLRDFRGYPALDPISLKRYAEVLDYAKLDAAIITDFNVRWVLDKPHFRYGNAVSFAQLPNPAFENRGGPLWEAFHPAPLVTWVSRIEVAPQSEVLSRLRRVEEPDGARRRAIVEPPDALLIPDALALAHAAPASVDGTLLSYEPDAVTVTVDAPAPGLVVLNEVLFPGWHVRVDGREATALRANYLLRAVRIDAGTHTITWRFDPPRWRALVSAYALALAALVAAGAAAWRRRRRAA